MLNYPKADTHQPFSQVSRQFFNMGSDAIAPARADAITEEPKAAGLTVEAAVKAVKAGNAKDVDIAAQIIADYADEMGEDGWGKEEEKKLMRKVDWWLIPIVC